MLSTTRVRTHTFLISFLILICSVAFVGCDNFLKISYDTVYMASVTYETSRSILGDLYKEGRINEEQKTQIVEVATKYYHAIMLAKKALIAYKKIEESKNPETLDKARIAVVEALNFMLLVETDLLKLII